MSEFYGTAIWQSLIESFRGAFSPYNRPSIIVAQTIKHNVHDQLFPSLEELASGWSIIVDKYSACPPPLALNFMFDDFLPLEPSTSNIQTVEYDSFQRSAEARKIEAILSILHMNRSQARQSSSILRSILITAQLVDDEILVTAGSRGLFGSSISRSYLQALQRELYEVGLYVLSTLTLNIDKQWHINTMAAIGKDPMIDRSSVLASTCQALFKASGQGDIHPRVLRQTLRRITENSGDPVVNERWLAYAQSLDGKSQ